MKHNRVNSEDKQKKEEEKRLNKEIDSYQRTSFIAKLPYGVKAIAIKYWFYGAVCFFVFMGLGSVVESNFNLILIAGLICGALNDVACYNILLIISHDSEANPRRYMIFKSKKVWSIAINILYEIVVFLVCMYSIDYLKTWLHFENSWVLREPFTQGLALILVDELFITIKNLIVKLVKKGKKV